MAKKEINVALIGQKFMGKAHSNAYRKLAMFFPDLPVKVNMKVIVGRKLDEVKDSAAQYGWEEASDNWKKVVHRDDIHIVDICTQGNMHHPMVMETAKAGKAIICEKPLANSLKEAREMAAAAKKAKILNMCAFNYRAVPAMALAKQMIEEGRLGTIFHFRAAYQQDWIVDPEFPMVWRLKKNIAGSGSLGDIGAHIIDAARFLVGDIDLVSATMETFVKKRKVLEDMSGITKKARGSAKSAKMGPVTVDDAAIILARFKKGPTLGTFEATRFATGCKNRHIWEIYGSKGAIRWNMEDMNKLEYFNREDPDHLQGFRTILATEGSHPYFGAWWPPGHIIGYEHTFVHEIVNFVKAYASGKRVTPDFEDGVQCQAILDAVEKASKTRKWEKVKA